MEEGADSIGSAAAGPSMPELVERELEALRAVDGVTSATSYERQQRQPLNKSMVNVRLQGCKAPIAVHCSGSLPNLLRAALALAEKVAAILGGAAVAEGRRRADAERESAAATASAHTRPSSDQPGQPVSFFEKSRQIQQFEAEKKRAEARVREADGHLRSARLLVLAEQKAVVQAEQCREVMCEVT